MTADIGAYGRQSDSGVFTESNVFRHLEAGLFNLPPPRQIPRTNTEWPKKNVYTPYSSISLE